MRQFLFLLVVTMMFAVTASSQEKPVSKEATISGEVIDVACYLSNGARGANHIDCGKACAKAGGSLGILTADGKVYVSLLPDDHKNNPNHLLIDHVGHNVEAKGYVRAKGGVNGIMIRSVAMAKSEG
jgi:hypothetical protein